MRTILPHENNPALREISRDISVADITSVRVRELVADMKGLLAKEEYGVALAAVQIGEPLNLFIVSGKALARGGRPGRAGNAPDEDAEEREHEEPALPDQIYINPELLKTSRGSKEMHEGCLSVRGKWGMVPRAEKATIRAYDEEGRQFTRGASGFLAHVFQHEMDHLKGILYTDKATEMYDEEEHADE